jgi:hypothetical protein
MIYAWEVCLVSTIYLFFIPFQKNMRRYVILMLFSKLIDPLDTYQVTCIQHVTLQHAPVDALKSSSICQNNLRQKKIP